MVKLDQDYTKASIICLYIVAALYALLSLLLLTRLVHRLKSWTGTSKRCTNLGVWVLSGFVVESSMRSASLFYVSATGRGNDDALLPPSILYYVLMCLLSVVWHRFLKQRQGSATKGTKVRIALLVLLILLTILLITLEVLRAAYEIQSPTNSADHMFPHHNTLIFLLDGIVSLLVGITFVAISWQIHKERTRILDDEVRRVSSRLLHGCLILAIFSVLRGTVILLVGSFPHPLAGDTSQSIIMPSFYAVQWVALMFSIGVLVGPQKSSGSSGSAAGANSTAGAGGSAGDGTRDSEQAGARSNERQSLLLNTDVDNSASTFAGRTSMSLRDVGAGGISTASGAGGGPTITSSKFRLDMDVAFVNSVASPKNGPSSEATFTVGTEGGNESGSGAVNQEDKDTFVAPTGGAIKGFSPRGPKRTYD